MASALIDSSKYPQNLSLGLQQLMGLENAIIILMLWYVIITKTFAVVTFEIGISSQMLRTEYPL